MGIIKDLKNIFFGASAVTKSATEKASEFIKEEGDDILDKAKELASKSGDVIVEKTSGLKDSILENSSDLVSSAREKMTDLGDSIKDNPVTDSLSDSATTVGEKLMSSGEKLMEKAGEVSENVGEQVIEKGTVLVDKGKDLSEDVGTRVLEAKDKLMEKAEHVKEELSAKLEDTMDKADAWAEHEKANPKPEFAEDTLDASGSLLEGTDDFFSKADKFATGDYGAFSEGKVTLDETKSLSEQKKFEELPPASGFEDLDGDGNELIDDAIVED